MSATPGRPTFTVLTPTYNRAHLLPRLRESLLRQNFADFEWLVVDDGSTDGTRELVAGWLGQTAFPVRYLWQENGGKHAAVNRGVMEARGELTAILDSDDLYLPQALERFWAHWRSIPAQRRGGYVGVTALCVDTRGELVGSAFPADALESDALEMLLHRGIKGDKKGVHRTDVLREHAFPRYPKERYVPESLVWNRIARRYRTLYVNEALSVVEYQPDGMTATEFRNRAGSPRGARQYYEEFLSLPLPLPFRARLRNHANYVRYSLHAGLPAGLPARRPPELLAAALGAPVGALLYALDRYRLARLPRQRPA